MNERDKAALKDSGIQWVGLIPKEWDVIRLKNSVEGCFNGIWGDDPDEGFFDTPCIRVADFDRTNNSVSLKKLTMRKIELASSNPRFLKRGDLLIEKSGGGEQSPVGNVVIFNHRFKAVCSNFVGRLPVRSQHSSHYWNFVHQSIYAIRLNTCSIKQNTGIQNLDTTQYLDERVPAPPLSEQRRIAAYLNRETAKIDKLISKQQKLIKLLKEKRQAVISQAVTKGLDPNVKMKDSGVKWLGIVPEHWTLGKLRNVAKIVRGASPRPAGDPKLFSAELHENGLPWVTVAEITKDEDIYLSSTSSFLTADGVRQSQIFKAGTFLFTNSGATLGVPKILDIDCCANDGVLAFLNITEKLNPLYLYFYLGTLTSTLREELKQGGGQPNLNTDLVKQIPFVYPSYEVQSQILAFLKEHLEKLRNIKVSCERNMQLLKEHKQALITAAVTGKIDVRGLVTDEEVAALDADPVLETTEEDFESEVAEADYITEEE